jgi:PIN domain nuclease of toxin-antitoxin system
VGRRRGEFAIAPLLLDTHYWIWFEAGDAEAFTRRTLATIQEAAAQGQLLVSVISIWELGLLESRGRVQLNAPCEEWVRNALATPGLSVAPLTPEIALDSTRLPGRFHADPADRFIAATARRLGARLLTRDERLLDYAAQGYLQTL